MVEEAVPRKTAGQEPARPAVRKRTFRRLNEMDRAEDDLGLEELRLPVVPSCTQTPAKSKQSRLSAAPEQGQCEQWAWGIGDDANEERNCSGKEEGAAGQPVWTVWRVLVRNSWVGRSEFSRGSAHDQAEPIETREESVELPEATRLDGREHKPLRPTNRNRILGWTGESPQKSRPEHWLRRRREESTKLLQRRWISPTQPSLNGPLSLQGIARCQWAVASSFVRQDEKSSSCDSEPRVGVVTLKKKRDLKRYSRWDYSSAWNLLYWVWCHASGVVIAQKFEGEWFLQSAEMDHGPGSPEAAG